VSGQLHAPAALPQGNEYARHHILSLHLLERSEEDHEDPVM